MSSSDTTESQRGHPSPMMFVSIGLGTVVAVALIVVVSILTGGKVTTSGGQPTNALVGKSVSAFTLGGLNGGTVTAPWATGHPGVLIFFASYCGPCKAEMPKVANYLRTHDQGAVHVVGIDVTDERSKGQRFVATSSVRFPVAFDPHAAVTSGNFQINAIPDTVFVSARGIITQVYVGAIPKDQLIKGIEALRSA
jgi:cytochrome c biogenesis protein CcmG/thiol:disulfide interchange protein DsbE